SLASLLSFRFLTGFFLAGIYPVGMKIAADYFDKGLGKSLGFLVGALVLGTAFPHLLNQVTSAYPWQYVLVSTSVLATAGGLAMLALVPNGPFRKASQGTDLSAFFKVFKKPAFRSVAIGYFGHMWELYAFWAFVPIMLQKFSNDHSLAITNIPMISFLIIGIGGIACVLGGYLSQRVGPKKIAQLALALSGVCCVVSPLVFASGSEAVFIGFLLFWGMVVIADSPLLSTLVAQNAPTELKGTALTIVNCIGFSITIISIQLLSQLQAVTDSNAIYMLLALGPILGLLSLRNARQKA
ncbi:MAG: nitrate/nitrite transporter, partial [Saprospiraceae bacterium]